jgi:hypothetical protein
VKGIKGEALKIYGAIGAFHKATVVQMVKWSFSRAEFRLDPTDLVAHSTMNPHDALA